MFRLHLFADCVFLCGLAVLLCGCAKPILVGESNIVLQPEHTIAVNAHVVTFSPDGSDLFTGSDDGVVQRWSVRTGELKKSYMGHGQKVRTIAVSKNGTRLLSGGGWDSLTGQKRDYSVRLWDAESGEQLQRFEDHSAPVWSVAFSPDGELLASSGEDGKVCIRNLSNGQIASASGWARVLRFSPDGKTLYNASEGWLIDNSPALRVLPLENKDRSEDANAISADGQFAIRVEPPERPTADAPFPRNITDRNARIVLLSFKGEARTKEVWELVDQQKLQWAVWSVGLANDNSLLAIGTTDGAILFDVSRKAELARLGWAGHPYYQVYVPVSSIQFSPDKQRVAAAFGRIVGIWRVR